MPTNDRLVQASIKSGAIVTNSKGAKSRHLVDEPDVASFERGAPGESGSAGFFEQAMKAFAEVKLKRYKRGEEPKFMQDLFYENA